MRARAWFGTVWDDSEIRDIRRMNPRYLLVSAEDNTEEGQIHRHVLAYFANARRGLRSQDQTSHWEPVKDMPGAIQYILEKGTPFLEKGERPVNKQNKDEWSMFVQECKTRTPQELVDGPYSKLYAKYRGFAGEVNRLFNEQPIIDGELPHEWWWGPPGVGKTRKAWEEHPDLYVKSHNKWWDGYNNEEVVLIDDWGPQMECLSDHLKQWADRYPFPAEVKGSSFTARPGKIIITSNYSIDDCFTREEDRAALRRRFKVTRFFI